MSAELAAAIAASTASADIATAGAFVLSVVVLIFGYRKVKSILSGR